MLSLSLAFACLAIILVSLLYIKIEITAELIENENQRKLIFEVLPGVANYKKEINLQNLDFSGSKLCSLLASVNDGPISGSPLKNYLLSGLLKLKRTAHNYLKIGQVFKKYILIDELDWKTVIGLDDAMHTALATGSIWAFKGSLLSYLSSQKRLKKFKLDVVPEFSARICWSHLNCILKVRLGHIILVDIFLLIHRFRRLKTGNHIDEFYYLTVKYAKSAILHQIKKWGCLHGSSGRKTEPSD